MARKQWNSKVIKYGGPVGNYLWRWPIVLAAKTPIYFIPSPLVFPDSVLVYVKRVRTSGMLQVSIYPNGVSWEKLTAFYGVLLVLLGIILRRIESKMSVFYRRMWLGFFAVNYNEKWMLYFITLHK